MVEECEDAVFWGVMGEISATVEIREEVLRRWREREDSRTERERPGVWGRLSE